MRACCRATSRRRRCFLQSRTSSITRSCSSSSPISASAGSTSIAPPPNKKRPRPANRTRPCRKNEPGGLTLALGLGRTLRGSGSRALAVGLGDLDRFDRNVVHAVLGTGLHLFDGVHDLLARHDLAEHRVTVALRRLGLEVQERVVLHVNEELAGSTVRVAGASHGDSVLVVEEP